jgi:transposase-like protein
MKGGAMEQKRLSPEEIAGIIAIKETLEKIGQGSLINVKALCKTLGISRKTAYKYYHQAREKRAEEEQRLKELSSRSQENAVELEALKNRLSWLEIENGALKIAQMAVEDLKKKGF